MPRRAAIAIAPACADCCCAERRSGGVYEYKFVSADGIRSVEVLMMVGTSDSSEPHMTGDDTTVVIATDSDIVSARESGRTLVSRLGFSATEVMLLATAVSELARNIVLYATRGEIVFRPLDDGDRKGILVIARDHGPGIPDMPRALGGGYSTRGGLGLGLSGTRRLMDEFDIVSAMGSGTTVTIKMWRRLKS